MSSRGKEGSDDPKRSYFFDNCVSPNLVKAMRCLDVDVRHLKELYEPGELDVDWIPKVTANRWVIVTNDRKITVREHERAALKAAGSIAFFLPGCVARKNRWEQVLFVFKVWPNIEKLAAYARPGDCYDVHEQGKITAFVGL